MKATLGVLTALAIMHTAPASAESAFHQGLVTKDEVQHSGGCRKSSPPGQCCHAGSKPYHCH